MNFIKRHKLLIIFLTIIVIVFITGFILLKQFFVDSSKDEYGNRLDNIESVTINEDVISKMKQEIKELEEVNKISYRLQGRLIYITIIYNDGVLIETAKEIASKTLEYFTDDEKNYYDIQIIIKNTNEEIEGYPKIGYKHKTSEGINW